MTVQLMLPYPPSANKLLVRNRGRVHRSARYETWRTQAGLMARSQKPGNVVGPYKLTIHAKRPDSVRRDIDNLIKPVSDLLQMLGIVRNDSDCEMVVARWVTWGEGITVLIDRAGVE